MQITEVKKIYSPEKGSHRIYLMEDFSAVKNMEIPDNEKDYILALEKNDEVKTVHFNHGDYQVFYVGVPLKKNENATREAFRLAALKVDFGQYKPQEIVVSDYTTCKGALYFAEGMILSAYKFDKYKSKRSENTLRYVFIENDDVEDSEVDLLNISLQAAYRCRDLSNEPQSVINSVTIAGEFSEMCEETGARIEVFNKRKIESLKMGGILAVNRGSVTEPTLSLMTWKPENAVNKKPVVFVGKGVVFDSGGLNIKTGDFMYDMKMDMAGAAAVSSAFWAVAKAKLPVYLVAVVPATDNRPGGEAYAPGDIIKMYNGKTVEVINTDAEGRLILADALSYAAKLDPEMVIDLATLTGSAARAVGNQAVAAMKNDGFGYWDMLKDAADAVYERLVEFPMWEEYAESIKSDFADIKNLGGAEAGMITAAKFLENFVDYPWVHLDIAGPAILSSKDRYHPKGGSGVGARLLFDFIVKFVNKQK